MASRGGRKPSTEISLAPSGALLVCALIPTVSPWAIFGRRSATSNECRENLPCSHLTPLAGEFIFNGVKLALRKTKKHSISKYAEVLKARGSRSDDLADVLRGIQRGLDEMKAGTGKPFRVALDEIRAKHNIPFRNL